MKTKKIQIVVNLLAVLCGGIISYFIFSGNSLAIFKKEQHVPPPVIANDINCSFYYLRETHFNFIKPVLYREKECESEVYGGLKASIMNYIDDSKRAGRIINASIYFRNLSNAEWIGCNSQLTFNPGSLAKVPLLITYLRMAEGDRTILDKKIVFDKMPAERIPTQTFQNKSIQLGKSYTVKELLEYMSVYSDNSATFLLNKTMNVTLYKNTFLELGIPVPSMADRNYEISTKSYSRFLWALYNSSYLSKPLSEYACSLLSKAEFREGLLKELPDTIKIIHKFGEFGNEAAGIHQLHESAIIYLDGKHYELTVMTRGRDKKVLPGIISHISAMVYQYMKSEA